MRIGVHASEAEQEGLKYRGMGVHKAARIGALAEAGQILASQETVAGQRAVSVSSPRTVSLKGVDEPVDVVTVQWE